MAKLDADIAEALQQEKDHTNKAEAGKWRDYGDGLKVQHRELDGFRPAYSVTQRADIPRAKLYLFKMSASQKKQFWGALFTEQVAFNFFAPCFLVVALHENYRDPLNNAVS